MNKYQRPNPRHAGKLDSLPQDQRQQLDAWLKQGLTYSDIVAHLASQFGVKTASSTLSNYFARHFASIAPTAELRGLSVNDGTLEFEVVMRIRVRRSDLVALNAVEPTKQR
jgi:hypothetical protein